jgi:hypothetical protein
MSADCGAHDAAQERIEGLIFLLKWFSRILSLTEINEIDHMTDA